jgi:hypothetical protein
MANSGAVDRALIQLLESDATLVALCPDGVFYDVAPQGARNFLIVSVLDHHDVPMFGGTAREEFLYLVKAVMFDTVGVNAQGAAEEIDRLLLSAPLLPDGYAVQLVERVEYLRLVEVDEQNPDVRWQHRGGHYEVTVQTIDSARRRARAFLPPPVPRGYAGTRS